MHFEKPFTLRRARQALIDRAGSARGSKVSLLHIATLRHHHSKPSCRRSSLKMLAVTVWSVGVESGLLSRVNPRCAVIFHPHLLRRSMQRSNRRCVKEAWSLDWSVPDLRPSLRCIATLNRLRPSHSGARTNLQILRLTAEVEGISADQDSRGSLLHIATLRHHHSKPSCRRSSLKVLAVTVWSVGVESGLLSRVNLQCAVIFHPHLLRRSVQRSNRKCEKEAWILNWNVPDLRASLRRIATSQRHHLGPSVLHFKLMSEAIGMSAGAESKSFSRGSHRCAVTFRRRRLMHSARPFSRRCGWMVQRSRIEVGPGLKASRRCSATSNRHHASRSVRHSRQQALAVGSWQAEKNLVSKASPRRAVTCLHHPARQFEQLSRWI